MVAALCIFASYPLYPSPEPEVKDGALFFAVFASPLRSRATLSAVVPQDFFLSHRDEVLAGLLDLVGVPRITFFILAV